MKPLRQNNSRTEAALHRSPVGHTIASWLLAFCQANLDHYQELNMEAEALVLEGYMKRIEEKS